MQLIQTNSNVTIPRAFRRGQGSSATDSSPYGSVRERLEQRQFAGMLHAFRPYGGFSSGQEMARHLSPIWDDPWSALASWIMSRSVLVVTWSGQTLVPMFQFDRRTMSLDPTCARVAAELKPVFDDWELVQWFATPNTWLDDARPVEMLACDEFAVLQAARTDSFIARG